MTEYGFIFRRGKKRHAGPREMADDIFAEIREMWRKGGRAAIVLTPEKFAAIIEEKLAELRVEFDKAFRQVFKVIDDKKYPSFYPAIQYPNHRWSSEEFRDFARDWLIDKNGTGEPDPPD